jgi:hypothetical protein
LKVVSVISCDAEAVLKSQATINHLASKGIKLAPRIPYEHEKIAERSMRILREKMNAKLSELPYTLPKALYDRLAFSIINNHNNLPNSKTTPRTPAEIITGEKLNFFAELNQFISKTENNDRLNYSVTHKYVFSTYFMSLCPFHT